MNIVLVEDEGITTLFLKECLISLKHKVLEAFCESQSLYAFLQQRHHEIDAVFLDILLKGQHDGIEIAQKVRKLYPNIAVIFITSYKDSDTIERASFSKPNGYLIKPVQQEDIEAALMVISASKRTHEASPLIAFAGNYTYDKNKKMVYDEQGSIDLTYNELKCLSCLVQNKNSCVSIEQLQQAIWSESENRIASLRELLYRIRKKLPNIELKSIPNVGYVLH
jgi:DNA-binding response OmpR family regulator